MDFWWRTGSPALTKKELRVSACDRKREDVLHNLNRLKWGWQPNKVPPVVLISKENRFFFTARKSVFTFGNHAAADLDDIGSPLWDAFSTACLEKTIHQRNKWKPKHQSALSKYDHSGGFFPRAATWSEKIKQTQIIRLFIMSTVNIPCATGAEGLGA